MNLNQLNGSSTTRAWITIGAGLFLLALAISAQVVPELRLLHFLQALIYVAVVILAHRNSSWGFGAGFTIAVFWNSFSLFVTHLMQSGVIEFWSFVHTGQVRRLETMMVPLGGIGHFILIIACAAAVLNETPERKKWWKFAGGGFLTLAYFALIVAVARPR